MLKRVTGRTLVAANVESGERGQVLVSGNKADMRKKECVPVNTEVRGAGWPCLGKKAFPR